MNKWNYLAEKFGMEAIRRACCNNCKNQLYASKDKNLAWCENLQILIEESNGFVCNDFIPRNSFNKNEHNE